MRTHEGPGEGNPGLAEFIEGGDGCVLCGGFPGFC